MLLSLQFVLQSSSEVTKGPSRHLFFFLASSIRPENSFPRTFPATVKNAFNHFRPIVSIFVELLNHLNFSAVTGNLDRRIGYFPSSFSLILPVDL